MIKKVIKSLQKVLQNFCCSSCKILSLFPVTWFCVFKNMSLIKNLCGKESCSYFLHFCCFYENTEFYLRMFEWKMTILLIYICFNFLIIHFQFWLVGCFLKIFLYLKIDCFDNLVNQKKKCSFLNDLHPEDLSPEMLAMKSCCHKSHFSVKKQFVQYHCLFIACIK